MAKKGTRMFWKACMKDGVKYRKSAYGYEHIINGRSFFCEDEVVDEEYTRFTDKATGYDVGKIDIVKERFDKLVEKANDLPDIFTYPTYKEVEEELKRRIR